MNSVITNNIIRFIVLLLLQVLICNNINFFGSINPYIYIIFIFLYPVKNNRLIFLLVSFMLGMMVDMFVDSGGVHAAASVFIAYTRPIALKSVFGTLYEHQTIKFNNFEIGRLTGYITLMTFTHHLILFSLEIFNISRILLILEKTFFSSIFTIILSILLIILFSRNRK